jgi:hypothetical protein
MYRPNVFLMRAASANPLVLAVANIFVDGVLVTTLRKSVEFSFGVNYYFAFDVSKVLQDVSAPKAQTITSVFDPTLNQPYNTSNTDCHTETGIIVTYFYRDPVTNILTNLGITDTIPASYYAINATRQTRDDMSLDAFVMTLGSDVWRFLTNHPNPYPICDTENLYLTFIPYLSNSYQVKTYDSGGVLIDEGKVSLTPNNKYVPTTIGAGMVNLASVTYFDGAVNMADPNIAYYTIQVGNSFLFGLNWLFIEASEIQRFNVIECCGDRDVRLHFLNRLGGADAYTFKNKKKRLETNKSEQAQKPQSWGYTIPPNLVHDKGRFKIQNETQAVWECESVFYDRASGEWIAELLSSTEVYLETSAGLVSVVITDSEITIEESNELINVSIKFVESNDISTQQN